MTLITHNKAVEELVHCQAEHAERHVADRIEKVKVSQYLSAWLGERAVVTHHAHRQNNTIQNLIIQYTVYDMYVATCQCFSWQL